MVTFPNCKINLGLYVTSKRSDGYHNIATVFIPVDLQDALEIIPRQDDIVMLQNSGLPVQGREADNLCVKAWHLVKGLYPQISGVNIYLHKIIPMGAGLGGGSADGAFMLCLLNDLFRLQMPETQLLELALLLGSDCPFFIHNKPRFASGRGELMEPIAIDLSAYKIVLINPGIHISTAFAFAQVQPANPNFDLRTLHTIPVQSWKTHCVNVFEAGICKVYPVIQSVKDALYNAGAIYASMTGTGSTVFGLFHQDQNIPLSFPPEWVLKS